ncbi:serine hydrolase domain-containing protein [Vandammella animalimorsus]|uniref:Alkaline D-peptidase n=1 Tax=Vandammella animalimorsus TaxID=2029117 RepID=A0A2A2AA80_9BURK|nr:serine hydrolase domain-containing protein [Vandammella animalimorsus]PAT34624.1 alkaline D-peptidase [Vandammella animalimorsus]
MSGHGAQDLQTRLAHTLAKAVDGRRIFGAAFCLGHQGQMHGAAAGDLDLDTPFFIASVTKLFTTALIMQLRRAGALALDEPVARHLDAALLQKLPATLTPRQLLAHTAGLPDYFEGADAQGRCWLRQLRRGPDFGWSAAEALARSRQIGPARPAGATGRARYSDSHYQLLGLLIEYLTGQPLAHCYAQHICAPLGLTQTYLYQDPADRTPRDIYDHARPLHRPLAMASFRADGGMVSTAPELLRFVQAFFGGELFPASDLHELQVFRPLSLLFPMQAGVGLQRLKLPWLLDPLRRAPPLLGHIGLSGALALHCPRRQIAIAGTVNQLAVPGTALRLALRIFRQASKG